MRRNVADHRDGVKPVEQNRYSRVELSGNCGLIYAMHGTHQFGQRAEGHDLAGHIDRHLRERWDGVPALIVVYEHLPGTADLLVDISQPNLVPSAWVVSIPTVRSEVSRIAMGKAPISMSQPVGHCRPGGHFDMPDGFADEMAQMTICRGQVVIGDFR